MIRHLVHYGLHFLVPIILVLIFYKDKKWTALLIFFGALLIDLDHLWANTVFDPNRCSIGFHPLHSYWAIALYVLLIVPSATRLFGLALCLHIIADAADCMFLLQGK